jgi:protein-S-isoprenylcysteine O-methyltransferase Ste14
MEKVRRSAFLYFAIQGLAVITWWIILYARPVVRSYFQLEPESQNSLIAFWLPDLVFIASGSLAAALLIYLQNKYESAAMWFVTGAVSYAAVYTLAFSLMTDRGWLGVTLMLPAMLWSGVFAMALTVKSEMFRAARDSSTNYVVLKTFVQIIVVWSVILLVFPYLITILEQKLGIVPIQFQFQKPIALAAFAAISILGIWAAHTMSKIGRGTPLPLDHARKLVVRGPYSYVRNPMAVSGIGQGLAVALFLGSPLVVIYALMGSLIWQLVFRPLEEDDLAKRFGGEYETYRSNVKCWIPRTTAYHIDGTADSSNSIARPSGSM